MCTPKNIFILGRSKDKETPQSNNEGFKQILRIPKNKRYIRNQKLDVWKKAFSPDTIEDVSCQKRESKIKNKGKSKQENKKILTYRIKLVFQNIPKRWVSLYKMWRNKAKTGCPSYNTFTAVNSKSTARKRKTIRKPEASNLKEKQTNQRQEFEKWYNFMQKMSQENTQKLGFA